MCQRVKPEESIETLQYLSAAANILVRHMLVFQLPDAVSDAARRAVSIWIEYTAAKRLFFLVSSFNNISMFCHTAVLYAGTL